MDQSSPEFRDRSPVLLSKTPPGSTEPNDTTKLSIEELYTDVLSYLKKSKELTRIELKSYLQQATAITPRCQRDKWILQKTRGLLKYILKKRAEFQSCVVKGEIIIYEKSKDQTASLSSTPLYSNSSNNELHSTNYFESLNNDHKSPKIDSYNYSQDMFAYTTPTMHTYAEKSYQFFKEANTLFKVPLIANPKIEDLDKIREFLEENCSSTVSLTRPVIEAVKLENKKKEPEEDNDMKPILQEQDEDIDGTIFDDVEIHQDLWKTEFQKESEKVEEYVQEIVSNLQSLEDGELYKMPKLFGINESKDSIEMPKLFANEYNSRDSIGSTELQPYNNPKNLKIIREACWKFRENLHNKKDIDFLQEFLNTRYN